MSSTPASSTSNSTAASPSTANAAPSTQRRRRTLQSGFSLMARGEPKIWLTGGMLVICLAMIVSLFTLIVVNGLSTFWPGPIDWLLLNDQQMDIGEPQRTEVRLDGDSKAAGETSPSRFYRTANFDVTNRHYRWFEPQELTASGIVRPEWALLIERHSWGRMLAIPSRLSRLTGPSDDEQKHLDAQSLLQELATELEPLAAEEPAIPLAELQAALEPTGSPPEAKTTDDPVEILNEMEPLLSLLAKARSETEQAMHEISLLDRDLAEARVAVRQAELDTGRSVIDKLDGIGPMLEALSANDLITSRIERAIAGSQTFLKERTQSQRLQQLLERYRDKLVIPARQTLEQDIETWKAQFADEPTAIRESISAFAQVWQNTLARKRPLEERIQAIERRNQGYELQVLIPSDAVKIELSPEDSQLLQSGKWTTKAIEQLSAQSIVVSPETKTRFVRFNDRVVQVEFDDPARGRFCLWGWQSGEESEADSKEYVWMLPQQKALNCAEIVRLFPANRLGIAGKLNVYASRWREFLFDNPREANTEGGVFPAIWGTIVMTLIMTLAVVPFGVIAALYLREYTRSGPIVSLVRISINNLAGVPSIVYGVFGLAFFCYSMGAFIDGGAKNAQFGALPSNLWYATLAGTVAVGVIAFLFSMLSSSGHASEPGIKQRLGKLAPALWLLSLFGAGVIIFKSPFFDGFYEARLPAPTFGKEGLMWASLTLALLTLPVVIVATEEALSAVPNSLREGSLACGASKWQTIYRIVLPHARPGILTGAILAMARGIGEVAPLMLVGALPVAPDLPLDSEFPYFHGSRSFMHLGYQIYWLGFQSQNSEASKPLVFTCTLLLILIVISLNLAAILLRARLRRRFQGNQF